MEWSKDEKLGEEGLCSWDQRGRTGSRARVLAGLHHLLCGLGQLPSPVCSSASSSIKIGIHLSDMMKIH